MQNKINEILTNIADTIREHSEIAQVSIEDSYQTDCYPAARITLEDVEFHQPDDNCATKWARLETRISVSTSPGSEIEGTLRVAELCESLVEAFEDEPTRDGTCCDLPIGQATEIVKIKKNDTRQPETEFQITLRCHFETEVA